MNEYEKSFYERQARQDEENRRLNDLKFNHMVEMGALIPEEEALAYKQAQVDTLRDKGMEGQEGSMAGNVFVAPSITQYGGQLANAYMARKGNEETERGRADIAAKTAAAVAKFGNQKDERGAAIGDDERNAYGGFPQGLRRRKKRFPEGGMV